MNNDTLIYKFNDNVEFRKLNHTMAMFFNGELVRPTEAVEEALVNRLSEVDKSKRHIVADALDELLLVAKAGSRDNLIKTIEGNITHLRQKAEGGDQ